MENNHENKVGSMPTVAEIMSEVTQISAAAPTEVPSVDSIQTPSVADIPSVPQVDVVASAAQAYDVGQAAVASTQPTAQPVQAAQPMPTAQPISTAQPMPTAQPILTAQPMPTAQSVQQPVSSYYTPRRSRQARKGTWCRL